MNICIECNVLNHNRRSGVMTYTEGIVNGLYQTERSHQYTLNYYSLNMNASQMPGPTGKNFQKKVLPVPDRDFLFRQKLLDNLILPVFLRKNKISVFHRPDGYTIPNIKEVFKVITIHDLRTLTIGDQTWSQNVKNYRKTLQAVNACVVVSQCTKLDLLKHFKVDERKVKVIYLGADKRFQKIDPTLIESVKTKYNIRERFLLSIGSVQRKNIDGIIKGFAGSRYNREYLLVLSCNMDVEKYRQLAASLGIGDRVLILDQLSDTEVVALYNGCHCFVFPSLYEGFGLPIVEAMQCGAPVITSKTSSCPEVAGDAAILVDPKNIQELSDAIDEICKNEPMRQDMIRKGLNQCKIFNWDQYAHEIKKVYEGAL